MIPVFFATDENYAPYLAIALRSLKDNASENFFYGIHVLHTGISDKTARRIERIGDENFSIRFVDVSEKLNDLADGLHLRDYYTFTTYYRIFISELFPEYDKALYLDSDIILNGDISELFAYDLGDNLVGAVTDETVQGVEPFRRYVKKALGIEPERYFNAGVLLMNLKKFREEDFFGRFNHLLKKYKFKVAQDQDYLNVLCKNRVLYLGGEWNDMPVPDIRGILLAVRGEDRLLRRRESGTYNLHGREKDKGRGMRKAACFHGRKGSGERLQLLFAFRRRGRQAHTDTERPLPRKAGDILQAGEIRTAAKI